MNPVLIAVACPVVGVNPVTVAVAVAVIAASGWAVLDKWAERRA